MQQKDNGVSAIGLTMMALGTVIGGSFFLGSAIGINNSGPSIILAYILGGILVYLILTALSEMTVANPAPGSFRTYAQESFGPGMGFTVGWVYWTGLVLAMSSETVAISVFLRVWFQNLSIPLLGTIIIVLVTAANLFGVNKLATLESGLAALKLAAVAIFIILSLILVVGLLPNREPAGFGTIRAEPFMPVGIGGLAGSMLIVMFTYAGFEIIGLTASEAKNPHQTVPRAIRYTVFTLSSLYIAAIASILLLLPSAEASGKISPLVAALQRNGINKAANFINIILVTAILSTMLAAMFGLGKMLRSLAQEKYAPAWLEGKGDIPYKGIIFSGFSMLLGFYMSFVLPEQVYLFLVSSGGFSLLFSYVVILASHYRYRKKHGCPPEGNCQLKGYPYTSWFALVVMILIIASMPLVPGQGSGLIAGLILVCLYILCYIIMKNRRKQKN